MSHVIHVTQSNFDAEVTQSSVPVLVDFYADWCGPCRMLAPTLEHIAAEFAGRAKIVKVNVDSESTLADQFAIQSIPTLVVIAGGREVGRRAGLVGEAALRQSLQQLTASAA